MGGKGSGRKRNLEGNRVNQGFTLRPETSEMLRIAARAGNMSLSEYVDRAIVCSNIALTQVGVEVEDMRTKIRKSLEEQKKVLLNTETLLCEVEELSVRLGGNRR